MAGETLRDSDGLLLEFPDNASGLIGAVASRDLTISAATGIGLYERATAFIVTMPLAGGEFVSINQAMAGGAGGSFAGNYWAVDGNGAFSPSYTDEGIQVLAGTTRVVKARAVFRAFSAPNGGNYQLAWFNNGVQIAGDPRVYAIAAGPETVIVTEDFLYDVSTDTPIDVRVAGVQAGESDLTVNEARLLIEGVLI